MWNAGEGGSDKGSGSDSSGNKSQINDKHSVTKARAACTALVAVVGTGNIAGMATALTAGGPGAIFWTQVFTAIGMMTAHAETSPGICYRCQNTENRWICGSMVYLEKGSHMPWLGLLYSISCILSSLGVGNIVQSNAIAETMSCTFGAAPLAVGLVLAVPVLIVTWDGIGRIVYVSERLMLVSTGTYIVFSLVVIFFCYNRIPLVVDQTLKLTLAPEVLFSGVGGYGISRSLRYGIVRGIFSNEARLSGLAILHGTAEDTTPEEQGMWAMFKVLFDMVIICTLTTPTILCIAAEGFDDVSYDGTALTALCSGRRLGGVGRYLASGSMLVLAFATVITWYCLRRQTVTYVLDRLGRRFVFTRRNEKWLKKLYLLLYLDVVYLGRISSLKAVWELSDIWNGLMAAPNVIVLVFLMREVTFPREPGG